MGLEVEVVARRYEGQGGCARILVDTAAIPGGGYLQLYRRGSSFEIMFGEEQLMGSWDVCSERALATLVFDRLQRRPERILIGGLGMGFTLAAARAMLAPSVAIVVAELVPKVVTWAGGHLAHIFGSSLADPRVSIELRDVHDVIVEQVDSFDAILLDVDNGPDGLISVANERLYCNWGLRAAYTALRARGMLAVWSAYPDDAFPDRLRNAGFEVEEIMVYPEGVEQDPPYTIWLAAKPE